MIWYFGTGVFGLIGCESLSPYLALPTSLNNNIIGGGWMICHFLIVQVHFVVCQLNFIVLFPFLIKYYHMLFINIVFWLGCDRPSGLLLFVPALLPSILSPLFLPSSPVSLSYLILAVLMREAFEKTLVHEFPVSYSHTEWYFLFSLFDAREY